MRNWLRQGSFGKLVFGILLVSGVLAAGTAHAQTISFEDSAHYWPGWENGSNDDDQDVIGIPDFTDGTITIDDNNKITEITFTFKEWGSGGAWDKLYPGDLFLSIDDDTDWEYVVYSGANKHQNHPTSPPDEWNIYAVNLGLNDQNAYQLSGSDNTGYWSGYYIRDDHPVGIKLGNISYEQVYPDSNQSNPAYVKFEGWGTTTLTFTFEDFKPTLTDRHVGVGFTVNCANDVVLYHTPEPASMLLLGTGLVGLAGYARRRKKQA